MNKRTKVRTEESEISLKSTKVPVFLSFLIGKRPHQKSRLVRAMKKYLKQPLKCWNPSWESSSATRFELFIIAVRSKQCKWKTAPHEYMISKNQLVYFVKVFTFAVSCYAHEQILKIHVFKTKGNRLARWSNSFGDAMAMVHFSKWRDSDVSWTHVTIATDAIIWT